MFLLVITVVTVKYISCYCFSCFNSVVSKFANLSFLAYTLLKFV